MAHYRQSRGRTDHRDSRPSMDVLLDTERTIYKGCGSWLRSGFQKLLRQYLFQKIQCPGIVHLS
jgi:hypothetical protein